MNADQKLQVNFGCGTHAPKHWLNFDSSFRVWIDQWPFLKWLGYRATFSPWVRRLNVTKTIPLKENSATHIYSSHMIEHLTRDEAKYFLEQCLRILQPGGRIRLMTPNLFLLVDDYLSRRNKPEYQATAADMMMSWLGMSEEGIPSKLGLLLNFGRNKNVHQWIYDEFSLKNLLEEVGFKNVESKVNWISDYPDLDLLEPADLRLASTCAEGYK